MKGILFSYVAIRFIEEKNVKRKRKQGNKGKSNTVKGTKRQKIEKERNKTTNDVQKERELQKVILNSPSTLSEFCPQPLQFLQPLGKHGRKISNSTQFRWKLLVSNNIAQMMKPVSPSVFQILSWDCYKLARELSREHFAISLRFTLGIRQHGTTSA